MIKPVGLLLLSLTVSNLACATVGGNQYLEFLGYEPTEQKVYLLRHYEDGRGRLPQLYYYNLKSAKSNQLVRVNSLYQQPKTGKIDYMPADDHRFQQQVAMIKKRLVPLRKIAPSTVQVTYLSKQQRRVPAWYDKYNDSKSYSQKDKVTQYRYRYQLKNTTRLSNPLSNQQFVSLPQTSISYAEGLTVNQAFLLPTQQKIIASVKYLGDNFETGYSFEDSVILDRYD